MKVEEFREGCFRIVADSGKMIESKLKHYDEEMEQDVANIRGEVIYLGKNDSEENYEEVEKEEEV